MDRGFTTKELVLVGGGHAHVHVLKSFGMRPVPGVRLTLIARDVETPYSGMLPGVIAGHYRREESHIDLARLARFAGARLVHDEAVGLDRAARRVLCRHHPPLRYDLLSLDLGAAPGTARLPGAAAHAIPIKPIGRLEQRLAALVERARATPRPLGLAVVGAGAGGVELVLALQHRLWQVAEHAPAMTLVARGGLLPSYDDGVRQRFRRVLEARGVALALGREVVAVEPQRLLLADGPPIPFDAALLATQAAAAPWLADTGLDLDAQGFVAVGAGLRSTNDPLVFAAGDVAAVLPHPRPKAGVFAVRQGPPLARNLRRALAGQAPRAFVPQRRHLSLISTGDRYAVLARSPVHAEGAWAWRLKDRIDRRWMRRYRELPAMAPADHDSKGAMRCGGCGAKLPAQALARVLARLSARAGVRLGADLDDAALLDPLPPDRQALQTVDFFRAFVDDPFLFGRIAANHALGDIYAMGGQPHAALAIACVPPAREAIVEEDLYQMLRGALDVLEPAGAALVGGHSAEAAELALGFTVTGSVPAGQAWRKRGLRPGDRLILTKPLGTGTLLAAAMRGRAAAPWLTAAHAAMLQPAATAAACLRAHGATACTDVTGFGLLGHLLEMLRASRTDATLDLAAVPALDGSLALLAEGVASSLQPANEAFLASVEDVIPGDPRLALLCDPQTAGGLLAGVPASQADACCAALRNQGCAAAAIVGTVVPGRGAEPMVRLAEADGNRTRHPG